MADLEDLKKDPSQPEMSAAAIHVLSHYKFPVMMLVSYPNGTIVNKINANDFLDLKFDLLDSGFHSPSSYNYVKFLKEGIQKAANGQVAEL